VKDRQPPPESAEYLALMDQHQAALWEMIDGLEKSMGTLLAQQQKGKFAATRRPGDMAALAMFTGSLEGQSVADLQILLALAILRLVRIDEHKKTHKTLAGLDGEGEAEPPG
jgi:hypothetical protein